VRPPTPRQPNPQADARTTTKREAPTPLPLRLLLDRHRTRHDALPEAGFAMTAIHSVALYTIPPHVVRTMLHDCEPPPLGLYKEGQSLGHRGTTDSAHLHVFLLRHDIGISPKSNLRDLRNLEAPPPLPPCLYLPSTSTTVQCECGGLLLEPVGFYFWIFHWISRLEKSSIRQFGCLVLL
jgi:hypothetical protein